MQRNALVIMAVCALMYVGCSAPPVGFCPNGACEIGENAENCPADCAAEDDDSCGNGLCDQGESAASCAIDCQTETLFVPSTNSTGVTSSALAVGVAYEVRSTGTIQYTIDPTSRADAEWRFIPEIFDWRETTTDSEHLDLLIDGEDLDWKGAADGVNFEIHTYSPSHVYITTVIGTGQPIQLSISDIIYTDNSGMLSVTITPVG